MTPDQQALLGQARLAAELYDQLCAARVEIERLTAENTQLRGRLSEEHEHVEVLDHLLQVVDPKAG